MAKVTLSNLVNLSNPGSAVSTINTNNDAIEVAMENTLSRDGSSPNSMLADLDMNSNQILNLPAAVEDTEPVRKAEFDTAVEELTDLIEAGGGGGGGGSGTPGGSPGQIQYHNALGEFGGDTGLTFDDATDTVTVLGNIELGHATANTLSASGGVLSIEGVNVLTTATGQPLDADLTSWAAVTRAAGFDTFVATPSSANLASLVTDETGSGALVFGTAPQISTIELGHASDTTLARVSAGVVSIEGSNILTEGTAETFLETNIDTLANLTSIQGFTVTLSDAGFDVLIGWDDSAAAVKNLLVGDIATEAAPAAGDFLVLYGAEGDLRKVNWNSLPGFGGGMSNLSDDTSPTLGGHLEGNSFTVGTTTSGIEDLHIETLGEINWGNGEVTITETDANTLTVAGATSVSLGTTTALTAGTIELGHASDTTISRVSAGVIAVEGSNVLTEGTAEAFVETAIDTLANLTSIQGLTVTLADAGADAIFGWDDSAAAYENLTQAEVRTVAGLATGDSPEFAGVNVGHPSDTTITRVSAGVIAVEGATIWTSGNDGSGSTLDADLLDGKNTGTSGNVVPLLDGANTWSALQTMTLGTGAGNEPLRLLNTTDNASVEVLALEGDRATMAANDEAYIAMRLSDSAGNQDEFARVTWRGVDVTSTSNDARITWSVAIADSLTAKLQLEGSALSPSASDGTALGTTSLGWADLHLATGGVINWANGEVTITETDANTLTVAGASSVSIGTGNAFTCGTIELGAASDTTISRTGAGAIAVEGATIWTSANDGTGSTLDADLLDGKNTGTSGNVVPLLDGANTWSAQQTMSLGSAATTEPLRLLNTTDNASVQVLGLEGDRATMAANDEAYVSMILSDSAGNQDEFARVTWRGVDVTSTSNDARLTWSVAIADSLTAKMQLEGTAFSPAANDGTALGTTSLGWADLHLATGGVINFANGEVTITETDANTLTIAGASSVSIGTGNAFTTGTIELGAASDTTLARSGAGDVTIEGNAIYRAGGTDVALADGGTGTSLTDPGADRVMAWDDSAGVVKFMPLADFNTEAAPAAGDYLLVYTAEDALVRVNWSSLPGAGGGITNVSEDTDPQLGGDLDANTFDILFDDNTGIRDQNNNDMLTFQTTTSAVNFFDMTNSATGDAVSLAAAGDDTDVGLKLSSKGAGTVQLAVNGTNEVLISSTDTSPAANDGNALGTTSLGWADLHLATGGVINWANGEVTITETDANTLTVAGASAVSLGTSAAFTTGTIELGAASDTTLARSAAGRVTVEGAEVNLAGTQELWIPANAMVSVTTGGAASFSTELATNDVMIYGYDFDTGATEEKVQFMLAMPKQWDEGTVTFRAYWTAASGSGTVGWGMRAAARSDDDALDQAFGTEQVNVDTLITANDVHVSPASPAITIGGTPAAADLCIFEVFRDTSVDTLGVDARLLGIVITINTNAANDA